MKRLWRWFTNKIAVSITLEIRTLSPVVDIIPNKGTTEYVMWAVEERDKAQRVLDQAKIDLRNK